MNCILFDFKLKYERVLSVIKVRFNLKEENTYPSSNKPFSIETDCATRLFRNDTYKKYL